MLMSSKPCSLALFGGGSASKSGCAQLMQHGWLPRESLSMCLSVVSLKSKKSWAYLGMLKLRNQPFVLRTTEPKRQSSIWPNSQGVAPHSSFVSVPHLPMSPARRPEPRCERSSWLCVLYTNT